MLFHSVGVPSGLKAGAVLDSVNVRSTLQALERPKTLSILSVSRLRWCRDGDLVPFTAPTVLGVVNAGQALDDEDTKRIREVETVFRFCKGWVKVAGMTTLSAFTAPTVSTRRETDQAFDDEGANLIREADTVFDSVKAPSKLTDRDLRSRTCAARMQALGFDLRL